ncbi:uncharacterized protein NimC3 [Eurosta solidaginis]|uniref:uncharacterized protein NimC3 n=1 Tax=Eurosta solidaginis TaxID=178769 RepID=UPI0035310107
MIYFICTHLHCCCNQQTTTTVLVITYLLQGLSSITAFTITGKYCTQNVSVANQETVTHNSHEGDAGSYSIKDAVGQNESQVISEPGVGWELQTVCCPGYRTLFLGFCQPICEPSCPRFSYCVAPNQCKCLSGYEEHLTNDKEQKLPDCRPTCVNGCPRHSECVARSQCKCRPGYWDTSGWLMPIKCQRIRCAALDERYDVEQNICVKIEMTMEDLMKKVAARLAKGLSDYALEDGDDGDEDEDDERENALNEVIKSTRTATKHKEKVNT